MNSELKDILSSINIDGLTITEISDLLDRKYNLMDISKALIRVNKKKEVFPPNNFGNCGINRDANQCGDASEY